MVKLSKDCEKSCVDEKEKTNNKCPCKLPPKRNTTSTCWDVPKYQPNRSTTAGPSKNCRGGSCKPEDVAACNAYNLIGSKFGFFYSKEREKKIKKMQRQDRSNYPRFIDAKINPKTNKIAKPAKSGFKWLSSAEQPVFGPYIWAALHIIANNYPVCPTENVRKYTKEFIMALYWLLPCSNCGFGGLKYIYTEFFSDPGPDAVKADDPLDKKLNWIVATRMNMIEFYTKYHQSTICNTQPFEKQEKFTTEYSEKYYSQAYMWVDCQSIPSEDFQLRRSCLNGCKYDLDTPGVSEPQKRCCTKFMKIYNNKDATSGKFSIGCNQWEIANPAYRPTGCLCPEDKNAIPTDLNTAGLAYKAPPLKCLDLPKKYRKNWFCLSKITEKTEWPGGKPATYPQKEQCVPDRGYDNEYNQQTFCPKKKKGAIPIKELEEKCNLKGEGSDCKKNSPKHPCKPNKKHKKKNKKKHKHNHKCDDCYSDDDQDDHNSDDETY